jgi:hypothetical protein
VSRILVVSVESPWPQHHGGRIRTANIAAALAVDHEVTVTYPVGTAQDVRQEGALQLRPLGPGTSRRHLTRLSRRPHLGGHQLRPVLGELERLLEQCRPAVVYWSHSYLAAWGMPLTRHVPNVVEFANIESARLRTLVGGARGLRRWLRRAEAAKSVGWEPAVARDAALCVALSTDDHRQLEAWGGDAITVANGIRTRAYQRSPSGGHVLAMASYDYGPNREAIIAFVKDVWPVVRAAHPAARLVIAGRGSEELGALRRVGGVEIGGTVADVADCYGPAAVTLAPAVTGGGAQLKITESFSFGRCCVGSTFSAASVPAELRGTTAYRGADSAAEYAGALARYLEEPEHRWMSEEAAWTGVQAMTWESRSRPLLDRIASLAPPALGSR